MLRIEKSCHVDGDYVVLGTYKAQLMELQYYAFKLFMIIANEFRIIKLLDWLKDKCDKWEKRV